MPTPRCGLLLCLIALAVLLRLPGMAAIPLTEKTEPRYAEISRLMAETGDWITPWHTPEQPFWGKPPLSFWAQAASIKWLGNSELAARLPSWIAMIGCLLLTMALARPLGGRRFAACSGGIFITMALPYVAAGAVMTDAYLALGITLSLFSFVRLLGGGGARWRWLFFLGLAVGLLAKGPIGPLLAGLPVGLWALFDRRRWPQLWALLPWFRGGLLTLALTLPWYLLAEAKTPGFLDYFIVGEHFQRFVDPGWDGDLYGRAHRQPLGAIWPLWLAATFPWGPLLIAIGCWQLAKHVIPNSVRGLPTLPRVSRPGSVAVALGGWLRHPVTGFLTLASLSPLLFFTFCSNILWTYILPALPPTAVLLAHGLRRLGVGTGHPRVLLATGALVPAMLLVAALVLPLYEKKLNSEKPIVEGFQALAESSGARLYYLGELPYSARYYSAGAVQPLSPRELPSLLGRVGAAPLFIAVPKKVKIRAMAEPGAGRMVAESKSFRLMLYHGDMFASRNPEIEYE